MFTPNEPSTSQQPSAGSAGAGVFGAVPRVERQDEPCGGAAEYEWPLLMLDQIDMAMMLVLTDSTVVHANRSARRVLDVAFPLRLQHGRVQASRPAEAPLLQAAIKHASERGVYHLMPLGPSECCGEISVAPVATRPSLSANSAVMLVFCQDRVGTPLALQWFAKRHRLTLAETKVLELICAGYSPNQIADAQGVAISTVRTQIASLRAKTCAASILSLVRQVALLPPLLSVS